MQNRAAACERGFRIGAQLRKVRRQYRRCQFNDGSHFSAPPYCTTFAPNSIIRESRPLPLEIGHPAQIRLSRRAPCEKCSRRRLNCCRNRNRSALVAALARQFEQAHYVERPIGANGQRRLAEDGVAQIGVEVAVVAIHRGNATLGERAVLRKSQQSPVFFRLRAPRRVRGHVAVPQVVFLRVKGLFDERALRSVEKETGTSRSSQNRGPQIRAQAARIMKREIERIIDDGAFSLYANISRQRTRHAEKQERVVDKVRRNVKKDARTRTRALAPGIRFELWPKAVV